MQSWQWLDMNTVVIIDNGTVFSMGDNTYGELGLGTTSPTPQTSPIMIPLMNNCLHINLQFSLNLML